MATVAWPNGTGHLRDTQPHARIATPRTPQGVVPLFCILFHKCSDIMRVSGLRLWPLLMVWPFAHGHSLSCFVGLPSLAITPHSFSLSNQLYFHASLVLSLRPGSPVTRLGGAKSPGFVLSGIAIAIRQYPHGEAISTIFPYPLWHRGYGHTPLL